MKIKVKYKTIWGKDRFQPSNDIALLFTQFTGKKTLTREQLIICNKLGFEVIIPNMNVQKYLSEDFEK
jgi:hypothetical protein